MISRNKKTVYQYNPMMAGNVDGDDKETHLKPGQAKTVDGMRGMIQIVRATAIAATL